MQHNTIRVKLAACLVLILELLSINTFATHAESADLTLRCLGGNQYEFTLSFYRDCCPSCVAAPTNVTINGVSASCNRSFSLTLNKIPGTGIEVSPLCASATSQCTNAASVNPGVTQWIYRGTYTLPASCSDWVFGFTQCCRNAAINTINSPLSENVYVEARLDNLNFPCNNSPVFSTLPIPFVCVGQSYCFSHGATDADGDSLSYALITPKTTANTNVSYIAPYSATQPLTSTPLITFNSSTGDICMTPTVLQRTVLAVRVSEWRNGQLVGSVIRDMQVAVFPCSNNTPYLTGINGTNVYNMSVCYPNTVSFKIPSLDKDTIFNAGFNPNFQNTTIAWNNGIPGASFTTSSRSTPSGSSLAIGTFTWTPAATDISNTPHCFVVTVQDNNCPITASQLKSFCITVLGASVNSGVSQSICAYKPSTQLVGTVLPVSSSVSWSGGGGTYNPSNNVLTPTYSLSATEITSGQAKLTLSSSGTGSCGVYTSTISITLIPSGTITVSSTNLSCNGSDNGTAAASISGGAPPFKYSWNTSPVKTTASITGLSVGNYTVTVTNSSGCVYAKSVTIGQPVAITTSTSQSNVSCFFGTNGQASVTAFGGNAGYSYLWLPGGVTTSTISALPKGTYTIIVSDISGCAATNTVTITQPTIVSTVITNAVNISCKGGNDGSLSASTTGGTAPYNYSWSPAGGTSPTTFNLVAGAYVVSVTDANGCISSANRTLTEPLTALTSTLTSVSALCNGAANGSASVLASGGTPTYSYLWTPVNSTSISVSGLSSGAYTVVVTDSKLCQSKTMVVVSQPPALALTTNKINSTCNGSNGQASIGVTGGTSPYSYVWSNGATTSLITNILSATYSVTVVDANNCQKNTSIFIPNTNPGINLSVASSNATCNGAANGSAITTTNSGTAPFNYLWLPSGGTASSAINLMAGNYTITVTDVNNCQTKKLITITQPASISLVTSADSASCGYPTGAAYVTATGGVFGYSYLWTPVGITNSAALSIVSGSYTIEVTDAASCTKRASVTISDKSGPVVTLFSHTDVSCFNGSDGTAQVVVTGGLPPYIYSWNTTPVQTTANSTGLPAGEFIATVIDQNNCVGHVNNNPIILQPTALVASYTRTEINCKGASTGAIEAFVSGGNGGYTYSWNPSGGASFSVSNLIKGTYTLVVTDSKLCTLSDTVTINEPSTALSATVTVTDVKCYGENTGKGYVSSSGGSLLYTYEWQPYGGNADTAIGLVAGVYTITVIDSKGCRFGPAAVTIAQPTGPLICSINQINVSCNNGNDGKAEAFVSGGTSPYSYSWSPISITTPSLKNLSSGQYKVTVTDFNSCSTFSSVEITEPPVLLVATTNLDDANCNQSNGQVGALVSGGVAPYSFLWLPVGATNAVATSLLAGSYTIQLTDFNNCITYAGATINDIPAGIVSASSIKNVSCNGGNDGSIKSSITGGVAPFLYSWSPSGGVSATGTNLSAGNYTLTVFDNKGCVSLLLTTVSEPPIIVPSYTVINALCFGSNDGIAMASALGGTAPYTYSWSTVPVQNSIIATSMSSGNYNLIITDLLGCTIVTNVKIGEPALLNTNISSIDVSCNGYSDGTATANVSGGTSPYSYSWNTIPVQITQSANNLTVGSHTVTITDSNGCKTIGSTLINNASPLITVARNDTNICFGDTTNLFAIAFGGNGGYNYLWGNGYGFGNNIIVQDSTSKMYTVTTFDSKGCIGTTDTLNLGVIVLNSNNLIVSGNTPICPGSASFISANVSATAGTPNYIWDNGLGTVAGPFKVFPKIATTYVVKAFNTCSVTVSDSIKILISPLPTPLVIHDLNKGCTPLNIQFKDSSKSIDQITSWLWDFGDGTTSNQQNPNHTYTNSGLYSVSLKLTTNALCSNVPSINDSLQVYPIPIVKCNAASTDVLVNTSIAFFANAPNAIKYLWDFGDNTTSIDRNPQHTFTAIGNYHVQVVTYNQYDCTDTCYVDITVKSDIVFPTIFTPNPNDPDGNGSGGYNINNLFTGFVKGAVTEFTMQIFNRWGEMLYETYDAAKGWNGYYKGKICEQDVYVWKAKGKFIDGRTFDKAGNLTLLR